MKHTHIELAVILQYLEENENNLIATFLESR